MHRRDFIAAAAGAVAAGTVGAVASSAAGSRATGAGATGFNATGSHTAGSGAAGASAAGAATAGAAAIGAQPNLADPEAFHAARRFARTAFGRIAYVERGSGLAALFLHGLPLNGYQWRGALDRLSTHRRCIAPDFMGLGYGEIPEDQSLSPAAQTGMIAALLDALGIDAVDLVANDSGNAVAQLFLVRHPERVRTLLLTNGDVHEVSPPPVLQPVIEASREGRFVDEVLVPQLEDPALALQPTGLGGLCYTDPAFVTPELLEVYTRPLVSPELRKAQFHRFCVELEPNPLLAIEPNLKRSRVPLRVVWGTGDPLFPTYAAEWLDRTFPNSRGIRWVEGAKLFFPEEMPDLVAEEATRLWLES